MSYIFILQYKNISKCINLFCQTNGHRYRGNLVNGVKYFLFSLCPTIIKSSLAIIGHGLIGTFVSALFLRSTNWIKLHCVDQMLGPKYWYPRSWRHLRSRKCWSQPRCRVFKPWQWAVLTGKHRWPVILSVLFHDSFCFCFFNQNSVEGNMHMALLPTDCTYNKLTGRDEIILYLSCFHCVSV